MWAAVEGWSIAQTCRALNICDVTAAKYMRLAQEIISWDAAVLQDDIVFGFLPDGITAEIEADETEHTGSKMSCMTVQE